MNRIARRSFAVIILAILLAGGFIFFLVEYFINAPTWAVHEGSAHAYTGEQFQSGVVIDRDGTMLLDMDGKWTYAEDTDVRKATLHWIGDHRLYLFRGTVDLAPSSHAKGVLPPGDPLL